MAAESAETKLAILESMVSRLDRYLEDDDLYKTITAYPPSGERLVKLTIGAVLDTIDELRSHDDLSPAEEEQLAELNQTVGRIKSQHDEAFFQKLARELKSYADSWRWFLQTCEDGDQRCARDYPDEVKTRLRIERLLEEAGNRPEVASERTRIDQLDSRLRNIWAPGDFVLRDEPADAYPRDRYWWLYGRPRVNDR